MSASAREYTQQLHKQEAENAPPVEEEPASVSSALQDNGLVNARMQEKLAEAERLLAAEKPVAADDVKLVDEEGVLL